MHSSASIFWLEKISEHFVFTGLFFFTIRNFSHACLNLVLP